MAQTQDLEGVTMKKSVKSMAAVAAAAAVITGGAVVSAPAASASTASFHSVMVGMHSEWRAVDRATSTKLSKGVCVIVTKYGKTGITASMQTMIDSGLPSNVAASVIVASVGEVCPTNKRIVDAYLAQGA